MRNINRIMVTMALSAIVTTAYSGSVNDSIETGDTLTAKLLNNVKTAINDNDGKVTALEVADDDMNVRVSILEDQPKAIEGFNDPSSRTEAFITDAEIGTVYTIFTSGDAYMAVAIDAETGNNIWKQLTPKEYAIGDIGPAGGWVFYVTADGLHGLEAAPVDQGPGAWGCSGNDLSGAQSTAIGSGARNMDDIIRECSEAGTAAAVADAYTSPSGYFDWYLPSKDELNKMYLNIGQGNTAVGGDVGGFASSNYYWSSSEIDASNAWGQFFGDGSQQVQSKLLKIHGVRAVRAF